MTPRSKHIGVKYFWFRSKVGPTHGINIVKCVTKDQLANIFNKGLPYEQLAILCSKLMGWTLDQEGVSQSKVYHSGFLAYIHSYMNKYGPLTFGNGSVHPNTDIPSGLTSIMVPTAQTPMPGNFLKSYPRDAQADASIVPGRSPDLVPHVHSKIQDLNG